MGYYPPPYFSTAARNLARQFIPQVADVTTPQPSGQLHFVGPSRSDILRSVTRSNASVGQLDLSDEEIMAANGAAMSMNENVGHNWRSYLDDEYDRLVNLSAMTMIAASRKPELSKQSAFYAKQAIARRGGMIGGGRKLVRDIALAVFSDVTDRAAEIYLNELRGRFSDGVISALEGRVTAVWRGAFDQMVQAFPLKH